METLNTLRSNNGSLNFVPHQIQSMHRNSTTLYTWKKQGNIHTYIWQLQGSKQNGVYSQASPSPYLNRPTNATIYHQVLRYVDQEYLKLSKRTNRPTKCSLQFGAKRAPGGDHQRISQVQSTVQYGAVHQAIRKLSGWSRCSGWQH